MTTRSPMLDRIERDARRRDNIQIALDTAAFVILIVLTCLGVHWIAS